MIAHKYVLFLYSLQSAALVICGNLNFLKEGAQCPPPDPRPATFSSGGVGDKKLLLVHSQSTSILLFDHTMDNLLSNDVATDSVQSVGSHNVDNCAFTVVTQFLVTPPIGPVW